VVVCVTTESVALPQPQRRPGGRKLSRRARRELAAYLFISPWIVGFLVFTAGAMLFSLGLTVFETDLLTGFKYVGLRNIVRLSKDPLFLKSLGVTFRFVAMAVPLEVIVALAIALALGLSGTAFWALTLKKSLAEATARLQAAAGAVAGAPTGGGPGGAAG